MAATSVLMSAAATAWAVSVTDRRGLGFMRDDLGRVFASAVILGAAAREEDEGRQGGPEKISGRGFHAILRQSMDSPATSRSARARL